jgi:hypothetical protein
MSIKKPPEKSTINAIKKIMNGDVPLASISIDTGAIASGELAASAVAAAKIMASAVNVNGLRYSAYTYSIAADAIGVASAMSKTYTVVMNTGAKVLGQYITKATLASTGSGSATIAPILTIGANSVKVSLTGSLGGSDLMEGVIITIDA